MPKFTSRWTAMDKYRYEAQLPRLMALKWFLRGTMRIEWLKPVGSHITGYYLKGEKV